jgi:anti-sigma factor RsiW
MTDHDETSDTQLHDELTAYLDGELDAESVRRVEERLARDADYRLELRRLERAWNMLDRLPRASVDEIFTKTTIEMVAVAAVEDAAAVQEVVPRRRRRQRLVAGVAALAAGVVGFFLGHALWPDPNRQLLKDLPLLEQFELYYQADNIEFLHMLNDDGLFAEGDADHAG